MKEYSKLRLACAITRAEVIRDQYKGDKFLAQVTQRIIEDIKAAIMFDEMDGGDCFYNFTTRKENEVSEKATVQK